MPCSGYEPIAPVMNKVRTIAFQGNVRVINNCLDLGVGMGQWGVMLRMYLDYYIGNMPGSDKALYMEGVEGFEGYRCANWQNYDHVWMQNILDVVIGNYPLSLKSWDLITMIEVLEHFDKEHGRTVLQWIKKNCKHAVISYFNGDQDECLGNPLEKHRAKWTFEEIKEIFPGAEHICGNDHGRMIYVKGDAHGSGVIV